MKLDILTNTNYTISKTIEIVEFFVYYGISLVVPFTIWWPQWLVWSLVNMALILAALNLDIKKLIPIIILPSLWVLARGIVFWQFTVFLVYMIPIIWIANTILVLGMKLNYKKWINLIIGVSWKVAFIFLGTIVLIKLNILPAIFIKSMWLIQLYTAIIWWILALTIYSVKKKYK